MMPRPSPALAGAPAIVRLSTVDSTQTVAFALAAEGAPDRTVVAADVQTAGRGRRGRTWEAEQGTSLLASILVRSGLPRALLPTLSLATAVATAHALHRVAGLAVRLKWPNDVTARGRKLAGILLESRGGEATVVIGIGINLGQRRFPPELQGRATSVLLETGRMIHREALLTALLDEFDAWRARLERDGFGPVREAWLALADALGQAVEVDGKAGIAVGLDGDGALLVREGATVHRVIAGEITSTDSSRNADAPAPPTANEADDAARG